MKGKLLIVAALSFGCIIFVFIINLFIDHTTNIYAQPIKYGYSIHIWSVQPSLFGSDLPHPYIYYEIDHSGTIIVPTYFLGPDFGDFGYKYNIKMVFGNEGHVACIYDTNLWNQGILILLDTDTGKSWPRISADEHLSGTDRQNWASMYNEIKLENPDMPPALQYIG